MSQNRTTLISKRAIRAYALQRAEQLGLGKKRVSSVIYERANRIVRDYLEEILRNQSHNGRIVVG